MQTFILFIGFTWILCNFIFKGIFHLLAALTGQTFYSNSKDTRNNLFFFIMDLISVYTMVEMLGFIHNMAIVSDAINKGIGN